MIVLGEEQEGHSILHVILGPETDFHFDLNGHSYLDISNYVHRMPKDKPVVLTINRCSSEEDVIAELAQHQMRTQAADVMKSLFENEPNLNTASEEKKSLTQKKASGKIKCPECGRPDSAIIKGGNVYPCETCQLINENLNPNKQEIEGPTQADLDQIRDELANEHPQQKKSLSRYKKDKKRLEEDSDGDL